MSMPAVHPYGQSQRMGKRQRKLAYTHQACVVKKKSWYLGLHYGGRHEAQVLHARMLPCCAGRPMALGRAALDACSGSAWQSEEVKRRSRSAAIYAMGVQVGGVLFGCH